MSSSATPAEDLLEPFLCRELRCVAEATRDRQISETEVGIIIEQLVKRILAMPTRWAIADALRNLLRDISAARGVASRKTLTSSLCELSKRPDPRSQIAGARMLAFLADRDEMARKELKSLFTSEESCLQVRGHAAIGLWRSGEPLKEVIESISAVASEIATTAVREVKSAFIHDVSALFESDCVEILGPAIRILKCLMPNPDVSKIFVRLMEHKMPWIKLSAAIGLGEQGYTDVALPTLIDVLREDSDIDAAYYVGEWGDRADAMPAVLKSLDSSNHWRALNAVKILIAWERLSDAMPTLLRQLGKLPTGPHVIEMLRDMQVEAIPEALPILVENLQHPWQPFAWHAVPLLQRWGLQPSVIPRLHELLSHEESSVRVSAVEILGAWAFRNEIEPTVLELLRDASDYVRRKMARALRFWPVQPSLVVHLATLLDDGDPIVRLHAAAVLRKWGHSGTALPTVIRVLDDDHTATREYAANLLASWESNQEAVKMLSTELGIHDQSTVAFLSSGFHGAVALPSSVSLALAGALTEVKDEPPGIALRREVLFHWLWRCVEPDFTLPEWDGPL